MVAVLLVLIAVASWSFRRLDEANRWNVHSYKVLMEIRSLTSSLFYLKRDAHQFSNTHDPKLASALKQDKADFRDDFLQTSTITADSEEQQARLRKLNDYYLRWLDEYTDPLLAGQDPEKAPAKKDMDAMRDLLKQMKQSESDLLDDRAARVAELQRDTALMLLAGGGFAVLLASALSTMLAKSASQLGRTNARLEHEVSERARAQEELSELHQELQEAHDDLDERVRLRTAELEESREQLRALATRVEAVREEEKTRMAREIHDQLGQALTGLKMDAQWLNTRLPKASASVGLGVSPNALPGDVAALRVKTETMMRLIDSTIQLVGKIASDLRPALLDDLGLVAAIEWQSEEFESRSGIACDFEALCDDDDITPDVATGVFRILQEALTNVARHAEATHVQIRLAENDGSLVLMIVDDGRGLQGDKWRDTKSLGLLGMRERALMIGGAVELKGAAGRGTTVTLRVPVQKTTAAVREVEVAEAA